MEFNEKDILLIEEYLDGHLSEEDTEAFKNRLKKDTDFAKAFEIRKKMPALIKDAMEFESTREEIQAAIPRDMHSNKAGRLVNFKF